MSENKDFTEHLNLIVKTENLLSPLPQGEIERRAREFLKLVKELSKCDSIKEFLRKNPLNLDVGSGRIPLFLILDTAGDNNKKRWLSILKAVLCLSR